MLSYTWGYKKLGGRWRDTEATWGNQVAATCQGDPTDTAADHVSESSWCIGDKLLQAANRVAINLCRGWETSRTLCCNTARTTAQIPNERSLIAAGCKLLPHHLLMHLMLSFAALAAMPRYAWMCCFCINQHRMGADDSMHFQLENTLDGHPSVDKFINQKCCSIPAWGHDTV